MNKFVALVSALVITIFMGGCASLGGAAAPRDKLTVSQMVQQEGGATVALMIYNDDDETTLSTGYKPFCTGVWVDETHILTANHCAKAVQEHEQERLDQRKKQGEGEPGSLLEALQRLFGHHEEETDYIKEKDLKVHYIVENEVIEVGKEPSAWHVSKVVGWDSAHDLALLEAVGKAVPAHRVAKLADSTPGIGESVHIVGQTVGMYWTYIQGTVAAYRTEDLMKGKDDKGPWMQVSSPMFFGNSGGGAFNDYGELVGIADWIKRAPEMGFFVHLDTIRSFLQDQNLLEKPAVTKKVEKKVVGVAPAEEAPKKSDD